MKPDVLIIGGHGCLGESITRILESKYRITSPCKNELDWCDRKNVLEFFKHRGYDVLINLSYSHSSSTPIGDIEKNRLITDNICLFGNKVKKIIHIGSFVEESGKGKNELLENSRFFSLSFKDAYEISKYYALNRISLLPNSNCLRIPCCYNSNCHIDRIIDKIISRKDCVTEFKTSIYPCFDIRDFARILIFLIDNPLITGISRISNAELISEKDIVEYIKYRRNNSTAQSKGTKRNEIILEDDMCKTLISYKSDFTIRNYIDEKLNTVYSVSK